MKHIISIIIILFLGFSPKCTAQTDHIVKLSYSTCFGNTFVIRYAVTSDSIVPTVFKPKKLQDIFVPEGSYLHLKFEMTESAKAQNILNGVSTFDMILLSKHMIRSQEITEPRALFALDLNDSGDVTISDFIEMRALIFGLQTNFKNNKPWRVFSSDKKNGGKNDTFTFLIDKDATLKFEAVKIGDINGNASCK
jgi:hypothetical protein